MEQDFWSSVSVFSPYQRRRMGSLYLLCRLHDIQWHQCQTCNASHSRATKCLCCQWEVCCIAVALEQGQTSCVGGGIQETGCRRETQRIAKSSVKPGDATLSPKRGHCWSDARAVLVLVIQGGVQPHQCAHLQQTGVHVASRGCHAPRKGHKHA